VALPGYQRGSRVRRAGQYQLSTLAKRLQWAFLVDLFREALFAS